MLSQQAFNALKTLEEPLAHFILATTEKHKRSRATHPRCGSFNFACLWPISSSN